MNAALETLRDRSIAAEQFREASDVVTHELIHQLHTQLGDKPVEFVLIIRAALAFLPAILSHFPKSGISFAGIRRDEETAKPHWYYDNIDTSDTEKKYVIIDPMLATGGSATEVARYLAEHKVPQHNLYFVGVLGAPEGKELLSSVVPASQITVAAMDNGLDDKKYIVPGLGDYGDRFFA